METTLPYATGCGIASVNLKDLVDKLVQFSFSDVLKKGISIANEIPARLEVFLELAVLSDVLKGILEAVVSNSRETNVRVTAKCLYDSLVEIAVKDNNSLHTYAIACSLQEVVPVAEKIGGRLDIMNQRQRITTISLTVPVKQEEHIPSNTNTPQQPGYSFEYL